MWDKFPAGIAVGLFAVDQATAVGLPTPQWFCRLPAAALPFTACRAPMPRTLVPLLPACTVVGSFFL